MAEQMSWTALRALPVGTRVRFTEAWDVWPHCVVEAGTLGEIKESNEDGVWVLTNDVNVTEALRPEWDGQVQLYPFGVSHGSDNEPEFDIEVLI